MKKLLLFTGALLWCGNIVAGVVTTTTPADSTRAKMEIKKMDFKGADNKPLAKPVKKEIKQTEKEITVNKHDIKENVTPINSGSSSQVNRSTTEEMKNMAKRDERVSAKKISRPKVSYPSYPGGNFAIREFVKKNQQYPEECKRERLVGRVEVIIAIAPDGTPHSATISKSSGNVYMDAEALRIAELMPKWNPAEESDDPQSIDHVIFVNFRPGR